MLKVKALIFLILSGLILISDLIITPFSITYTHKPVLAFLGILYVTYFNQRMQIKSKPKSERVALYNVCFFAFFITLLINYTLKKPIVTTPFIFGCFIQSLLYFRAMHRQKSGKMARGSQIHETPLPDISFRIMSLMLFVRNLFLNHVRLLEAAGVAEGNTVLDYGSGPGAFSIAATKVVGKRGMVYALDNHHLAIESVEAYIKKSGVKNLKSIYTNQGETGLPDNSVDRALLVGVLHAVKNPGNIFGEIKRVLKKDGRLILVSVHLNEGDLMEIATPYFELIEKKDQMYIMKVGA